VRRARAIPPLTEPTDTGKRTAEARSARPHDQRDGSETQMASHDLDTVLAWKGSTVVDRDGEKIGTLKELYLDQDDRPAWAAVNTGLFGLRHTFVPLDQATVIDDQVQVPFAKARVRDAPNIDPDAQLTDDEERRLYDHYGLEADEDAPDDGPAPDDDRVPPPAAARQDDHDGDSDAMTRSEEELIVGTRRRVRGKARLRKYVVTEHVQRTIPVQREEVRVEYEPEEGDASPQDDPPADRR